MSSLKLTKHDVPMQVASGLDDGVNERVILKTEDVVVERATAGLLGVTECDGGRGCLCHGLTHLSRDNGP